MGKKEQIKNSRLMWDWILLIYALCFMLTLFSPLNTYLAAYDSYWFSFQQMFPILLTAHIILLVVGIGIAILFSKLRIHNFLYAVLVGILFFLYIQGNYIPRNYGVLNGETIDWGAYSGYAIASIVLIVVSIILVMLLISKLKNMLFQIGRYFSMFLIAIQYITLGVLLLQAGTNIMGIQEEKACIITDEGLLEYSEEGNVVVFVLDTFDSLYMQTILNGNEEYQALFEDFIYYPNTVGAYSTTKCSLPFILTGKWYENNQEYEEYIENAYKDNELYKTLEEKGYSVEIYAADPDFVNAQNCLATNVREGRYILEDILEFLKIEYKLSLFQYMPHQAKRFFMVETEEFENLRAIQTDETDVQAYNWSIQKFYSLLCNNELDTSRDKKTFKVYHLDGVHPSYSFGKDLKTDKNQKYDVYDEVEGNFTFLQLYFNRLKESGLYDDTTVIIMADHGYLNYNQNALFMVKNANEKHDLRISQAPMSYEYFDDFLINIFNGNNSDDAFVSKCNYPGKQRRFLHYSWNDTWGNDLIDGKYMPTMQEIYIDGDAWTQESMIFTGNYYVPLSKGNYAYKIGKTVYFTKSNPTANAYCVYGFGENEEPGTWTNGNYSLMHFSLGEVKTDIGVRIDYGTFAIDHEVFVYANEELVANFIANSKKTKTIVIPKDCIVDGELFLKFYFPSAISPKDFGSSEATMKLALFMEGITLFNVEDEFFKEDQINCYYEVGKNILFNTEMILPYIVSGFGTIESTGMWTNGNESCLEFCILEEYENLVLQIEMESFAKEQSVVLYVNDFLLDEFTVSGNQVYEIEIPNSIMLGEKLDIRFSLPTAISPNELGIGDSNKKLAIFMKSIKIKSK